MGFFSSIGNAFKSVGKAVVNVGKGALSVVKTVATPLLSTAASLVPGIGPLLSAGVDILGNKLLGNSGGDATMDSGQVEQTPVATYMAANNGAVTGLGSSPIAQAMASSVALDNPDAMNAATTRPGFFGTLANATGIGDGKPGVFGIGDGKPGVFGIGTGKAKAKKEAAEIARQQAEAAAKGEGLPAKAVTLAGDAAAAKAEAKVEKEYSEDGTPASSGGGGGIALVIAAALALLL